jgi:hypothetical protein
MDVSRDIPVPRRSFQELFINEERDPEIGIVVVRGGVEPDVELSKMGVIVESDYRPGRQERGHSRYQRRLTPIAPSSV